MFTVPRFCAYGKLATGGAPVDTRRTGEMAIAMAIVHSTGHAADYALLRLVTETDLPALEPYPSSL